MSDAPREPSTPDTRHATPASPQQAADILDAGGLVLCVTETVFGIAASAQHRTALDAIRQLFDQLGVTPSRTANAAQTNSPAPLAWHAAAPSAVRAALDAADAAPTDAAWRRFDALAPGPVTAAIELEPDTTDRVSDALAVPRGTFTRGNRLLVRVPDHPIARALLERAAGPIVMAGVPYEHPRSLERTADAIAEADTQRLVRAVCDGPPAPLGTPSTHIDIERDGAWTLTVDGAMSRQDIARRLTTTILFVCTGNTCRSPIAEAVAKHLLESRPMPGVGQVTVRSAGASAMPGAPPTPEAVRAAERVGADASKHTSQPLTRELINEASVIFALTAAHAELIAQFGDDARRKTQLLDPEGADIPDPIGGPQELYDETARTITRLIEHRLEDAGLIEPDASER